MVVPAGILATVFNQDVNPPNDDLIMRLYMAGADDIIYLGMGSIVGLLPLNMKKVFASMFVVVGLTAASTFVNNPYFAEKVPAVISGIVAGSAIRGLSRGIFQKGEAR